MTGVTSQEYQDTSRLGKLLLAGLLGVLLLAGLLAVQVLDRDHAVVRHGEDAMAIRQCLDGKGPYDTWKFTSWRRNNHFIQTCQMDDGRWGLRIIQLTKNGWEEKTSFVVKSGTRQELVEYITARAVKFFGDLALVAR